MAQTITFNYQQEGTSEGFNKLIHNAIRPGIISGGTLHKESATSVRISPIDMIIKDSNNLLTVHATTDEDVIVNLPSGEIASKPYICAEYAWQSQTGNLVQFRCRNISEIVSNSIILGKCQFVGTTLADVFDYTVTSWSDIHWNEDLLHAVPNFANSTALRVPNFHVLPASNVGNNNPLSLRITEGRAFIDGDYVELPDGLNVVLSTSSSSNVYINTTLSNGMVRYDLLCLASDGTPRYINGTQNTLSLAKKPSCPRDLLPLAYLKLDNSSNTITLNNNTVILGSWIEEIPTHIHNEGKIDIITTTHSLKI